MQQWQDYSQVPRKLLRLTPRCRRPRHSAQPLLGYDLLEGVSSTFSSREDSEHRGPAFLAIGSWHPAFRAEHLSPTAALVPARCLQWSPGSPGPIRSSLLPPVHISSHQDGGQQFLWHLGLCPTGSPPCPRWAAALPAGCALPHCPGPWSRESLTGLTPLLGCRPQEGLLLRASATCHRWAKVQTAGTGL